MFDLGLSHFRFGKSLNNTHWRQRVSRFYYGAYNGSKAIRYLVNGAHSTDSNYARKLVTVISGGVFDLLDPVLERHSFDDVGEMA